MKTKDFATKTAADWLRCSPTSTRLSVHSVSGPPGAKSKNVREGRAIRKDIARIMTALGALHRQQVAKKA